MGKRTRRRFFGFLGAVGVGGLLLFGSRPVTADAASNYTKKGTVFTLKAKSGQEISKILNKTIIAASKKASANKPYTVKLKKGTYKLKWAVYMYSNVKLDATDVTLKCVSKSSAMLASRNTNSKKTGGYKATKNISVIGGTWKGNAKNTACMFRIAHSKNVLLSGCTFVGSGSVHQVEVAALAGFTVSNCTFRDMKSGKGSSKKMEALQLDVCCNSHAYPGFYVDGTAMKNVTVEGCTFKNVPRGIGTHSMLFGQSLENVTIQGNTFTDLEEEAVIVCAYHNCKIMDNTIKNCGAGIVFQSMKQNPGSSVYSTILNGKKTYNGSFVYDANSVISGNTMDIKYKTTADQVIGIKLLGYHFENAVTGYDKKKIKAGNYYLSGMTVKDNVIKTEGLGIQITDVRDSSITDNTVQAVGTKESQSIVMITNESKNIIFDRNTVKNSRSNGIIVQKDSTAKSISGNTIIDSELSGIKLVGAVVTDINDNVIKKEEKEYSCSDGLYVDGDSVVVNVTGNHISDMQGYSIIVKSGGTIKNYGENDVPEDSDLIR